MFVRFASLFDLIIGFCFDLFHDVGEDTFEHDLYLNDIL